MDTDNICPICENCKPSVVDTFNPKKIIDSYKNISLDVSNSFDDLKKVSLKSCQSTKVRFYYPVNLIGNDVFYDKLNQVIGETQYYFLDKWEFQTARRFIKNDSNVLDIGCGAGSFLNSLDVINKMGLEYNDTAIMACKKNGISVFKQTVEEFAKQEKYFESFNVVTSFQVLEHIYHVHSFVSNALKCLKKGGLFIIGTPNSNPYLFIGDKYHALNLPPHHMTLWNKENYINLESIFNLELISIEFEPFDLHNFNLLAYQFLKKKTGNIWGERIFYRIYKPLLSKIGYKLFSRKLIHHNRNILAIYKKK